MHSRGRDQASIRGSQIIHCTGEIKHPLEGGVLYQLVLEYEGVLTIKTL